MHTHSVRLCVLRAYSSGGEGGGGGGGRLDVHGVRYDYEEVDASAAKRLMDNIIECANADPPIIGQKFDGHAPLAALCRARRVPTSTIRVPSVLEYSPEHRPEFRPPMLR